MSRFITELARMLTMGRLSGRAFLLLACGLNVALRLPMLPIPVVPMADFGWYYEAARLIAAGRGYSQGGVPTAFWPVGWPAVLGGLLRIFGDHVLVGQCANLVLSVGILCLVAAAGKRLFGNDPSWRLAVLAIAVFPNQIAYVSLLSVEIFFEFLLILGFVMAMSRNAGVVLASGLVFGMAALTKSQAVLLPAVLALPLLAAPLGRAGIGRWMRICALSGLAMLAVILPWTYRNYTVFHTFVPISTNGGFTLLTGNNPTATGGYNPKDPMVTDLSNDPRDQIEMDRIARQRAWTWIVRNPIRFTTLIPQKILGLWGMDGEAEWMYQSGYAGYGAHALVFRSVRVVNQLYYWGLMALALFSVPRMWRQRASLPVWCWSGWAAMGYFTLISVVFSGQSRFHFALMPFVALYAGWMMAGCSGMWRQRAN